jgi:DNA-binding HxlR family transcriptional regulator
MRYSQNICPRFQHAVEILSRRWTGLIVRVLLEKPQRFSELADALAVVSDRVLSERLKELEQEGILERHVYAHAPVRVDYTLTAKGRALEPVISAIEDWSQDWLPIDESAPQPAAAED